jgi:hypothetical protein
MTALALPAARARRLSPAELRGFASRSGRLGETLLLVATALSDAIPLLRDLAAEARSLRVEVDSLRAELEAAPPGGAA